eukprot:3077204-Pleurochrysis_carterae.AAC.1
MGRTFSTTQKEQSGALSRTKLPTSTTESDRRAGQQRRAERHRAKASTPGFRFSKSLIWLLRARPAFAPIPVQKKARAEQSWGRKHKARKARFWTGVQNRQSLGCRRKAKESQHRQVGR